MAREGTENRLLWGVISTLGAVLLALGAYALNSVQAHAERITRLEESMRHVELSLRRIEAASIDINQKVDMLVQERWRQER